MLWGENESQETDDWKNKIVQSNGENWAEGWRDYWELPDAEIVIPDGGKPLCSYRYSGYDDAVWIHLSGNYDAGACYSFIREIHLKRRNRGWQYLKIEKKESALSAASCIYSLWCGVFWA
jgi:hypothetical protein